MTRRGEKRQGETSNIPKLLVGVDIHPYTRLATYVTRSRSPNIHDSCHYLRCFVRTISSCFGLSYMRISSAVHAIRDVLLAGLISQRNISHYYYPCLHPNIKPCLDSENESSEALLHAIMKDVPSKNLYYSCWYCSAVKTMECSVLETSFIIM